MKKILVKIIEYWNNKIFFASTIVFVLVFLSFSLIYLNNPGATTIDGDHFFHFEYANLLREKGISVVKDFKWIYHTEKAQEGIRYSVSLHQIALIPFTLAGNKILGLKLADIFFASFSLALFFALLRKLKVPYAIIFSLALLSVDYYLSRLLSGRNFVLAVALSFWQIYFVARGKYKWFFTVAFLQILWHQSTFFWPILAVAIIEPARYLAQQRVYWKNVIVAFLAVVLAMSFFPGFPANIFKWGMGLVSLHSGIAESQSIANIEGIELKPIDPNIIIDRSRLLLFLALFSIVTAIFYYIQSKKSVANEELENSNKIRKTLVYSAIILLPGLIFGALMVSGRFFDYYILGTIMFAAVAMAMLVGEKRILIGDSYRKYFLSALSLYFIFICYNNFIDLKLKIAKSDYRPIARAAEWVSERSDAGEVVFLDSWNDFTVAFFFNSDNYYTMGIEPKAIYNYNERLFWKWYNIYRNKYYCELPKDCVQEKKKAIDELKGDQGKTAEFNRQNAEKIVNSIRNDFQSDYAIVSSDELSDIISLDKEDIADKESFEALYSKYTTTVFEFK